MSDYQRKTVLSPDQVLAKAEELLPRRLELDRTKASEHEVTYTGEEGTLTLSVHRHGPYTVVTASTNRLRTSRIDIETQWYLNKLPYQSGDPVPER